MSPRDPLRHCPLQHVEQDIPLFLIQSLAFGQIAVKTAIGNEFRRHILVEHRRTEVERLLADIYLVQHIRMPENPTQSESRSHDLGKRPEMHGNVGVNGIYGRNILSFIPQFPVRGILHYQHSVLPCHSGQSETVPKRQGLPGRILEVRNGVDEFQPFPLRNRLLRSLCVCCGKPVRIRIIFHSPDIRPVGTERLQRTEIGRAGSQNDISGIRKYPRTDIYALLGRRGDLYPSDRDAVSCGQCFTEFRNSLGSPVLERLCPCPVYYIRHYPPEIPEREGIGRGIASGKGIYCIQVHPFEYVSHRRAEKGGSIFRK